ncbi:ACP S-malonyltransferase [Niallia sp. HCP3S3_B10]|jgi:trans-AT polyketide synthase, acyltransferase and oxidoreductase domains|uniref:ACP S-malonyltransferase n=1 Tax=Niallia sp. HCP3S3_B10 TaxID=3438944 RepID=UPI003F889A96
MKKIFLFAGQGCQYYGMGKSLYGKNIDFRRYVDEVDEEIVNKIGLSIRDILFDKRKDRSEAFLPILYTSLAIFMYEYSAAKMMIKNGIIPDGMIGSSLGEFSSAVVSNMIDMEDAISLIIQQSKLIMEKAPVGGMITVFDDPLLFESRRDIFKDVELISVNHRKNFVVSANLESIIALEKLLNDNQILHYKLPVQYAFHSSEVECLREEYLSLVDNFPLKLPKYEVISGITGEPLRHVNPDYFWRVLREPINFKECITNLNSDECIFIDLSPDGELAMMLKYILPNDKEVFKIASIFNVDIDVAKVMNEIKERGGKKMKAYVFPGQGSQVKGMGAELFDEYSEFTKKADEILGYSIKDLCLNDPENKLSQTVYTQPALFVVSVLSYLKKMEEGEGEPDYLAGHSIGEYAALFASGAIDFETGLKLVKKRGELMYQATGGQMAAVVGLTKHQVEEIIRDNNFTKIDIANMNTPTQIVIAGYSEDIQKASEVFTNNSNCFMYKILNVSGAFHSRYMQPAMEEFNRYLKEFTFNDLKIPVISNTYARPYKNSRIMETLSKQLVSSVQWTDSIRYLLMKDVQDIVSVGPGRVVQGMVNSIIREAEPMTIAEAEVASSIEVIGLDEKNNLEEIQVKETILPLEELKFHNSYEISPEMLGDRSFKEEYNLRYAYTLGGMYRGISGERLVIVAGKAGLLGFYGTVGVEYSKIENAIIKIQDALQNGEPYGFNLSADLINPERENRICDLFLKYGVRTVETSGYVSITKPLVKYRIKGLKTNSTGDIVVPNRIIAKLSRPEIAEYFMSPPPHKIVDNLLLEGEITEEEAELAQHISMANDICVAGDSGGHTDAANGFVLLPSIVRLRSEIVEKYGYRHKLRIGVGGGIGTPTAISAAFMMGADFITTGSINQCSVEAAISSTAKDMLSSINVQDTGYAPAWNLYETSSKVQVLKRGTLYQVRSNKLHSIYTNNDSIEDIDEKVKKQIEDNYFKKSLDEVYDEAKLYFDPKILEQAELNPKLKMAITFNWYYIKSAQWALHGEEDNKTDFQILCGSSLGAFNQWVKGTKMEDWRNRHVDEIGILLMNETVSHINNYCKGLLNVH